ncbi:MAG: S-layer homology domain-containing protein [Clostridia bacterium]|nr:S-layer homology domain-containing protein [Clostridia bacterium]
MKKQMLLGIITAGLVLSMSIPTLASELTIEETVKQTEKELLNSQQTNTTDNTTSNTAENTTDSTVVAQIKSFSDVSSSHWAYKSIMAMVNRGLFSGTTTPVNGVGTFSPEKTMTRAEFVTVVVRAMYPTADIKAINENWWSGTYEVAVDNGLIQESEFTESSMAQGITRQEMSMVLVRAAEQKGDTASKLVPTAKISDYSTVGSYYKDYVVKAYSMGMISGNDDRGTFAPKITVTRAAGAAVLNRLVDSSARAKVDFTAPVVTPEEPQGTGQTWVEGSNHDDPKVGDTVIKADGTKVVLKLGIGGVLGAGQGVDIYTGTVVNGVTAKEGMCSWFDGRPFAKDSITGEMHTGTEWNTIKHSTHPKEKGSNGEIRNTWWEYDTEAEIWFWLGPVA